LTLARTTWPRRSLVSRSSIGPSVRQGAQRGDQKSTTTGVWSEASRTSASKLASVTFLTQGEGVGFIVGTPRDGEARSAGERPGLPRWRFGLSSLRLVVRLLGAPSAPEQLLHRLRLDDRQRPALRPWEPPARVDAQPAVDRRRHLGRRHRAVPRLAADLVG